MTLGVSRMEERRQNVVRRRDTEDWSGGLKKNLFGKKLDGQTNLHRSASCPRRLPPMAALPRAHSGAVPPSRVPWEEHSAGAENSSAWSAFILEVQSITPNFQYRGGAKDEGSGPETWRI